MVCPPAEDLHNTSLFGCFSQTDSCSFWGPIADLSRMSRVAFFPSEFDVLIKHIRFEIVLSSN